MIDFKYPLGATPLDPNEIEGLKIRHITIREELNRFEQDNPGFCNRREDRDERGREFFD